MDITEIKPVVIALADSRDTTFIISVAAVDDGKCSHRQGSCGKPGAVAVRSTVDQHRPDETTTMRATVCSDHVASAIALHAAWVADARELQNPIKRAAFLKGAGVTD